jgi:SAM-dependent methyltransferase
MTTADPIQRFYDFVDREKLWSKGRYLKVYFDFLLEDVDLAGKTVLDVGAGAGLMSFYAASAGAARVIALEPEAKGSRSGMQDQFRHAAEQLGLNQVELITSTFQEYEPGEQRFDVIVMVYSINHLNEDACIRLTSDDRARQEYVSLFNRLYGMCTPGATLVMADCSPKNVFQLLGLRNPVAPTVEWHKHQFPKLWASLASKAGFNHPCIRWIAMNRLGRLGRVLFGNAVGAYLYKSDFCLCMTRP